MQQAAAMKVLLAVPSPQRPVLFFFLIFCSLSEHELQEESGDLEKEPEAAGKSKACVNKCVISHMSIWFVRLLQLL